jgi:hypothetical protein
VSVKPSTGQTVQQTLLQLLQRCANEELLITLNKRLFDEHKHAQSAWQRLEIVTDDNQPQVTVKDGKGTVGANPYGSIGAAQGTKSELIGASKEQVCGATKENNTLQPGTKDTASDDKIRTSVHALTEQRNISYKTNEVIVRMPGCVHSVLCCHAVSSL